MTKLYFIIFNLLTL